MDYLILLLCLAYVGTTITNLRWAIKEYPTERPLIHHGVSFDIFLFFCIVMPVWNTFIMIAFVWERHKHNKDMKDYIEAETIKNKGCDTEEYV